MNMTFIENLEFTGISVNNCKTIKKFMHDLKNYVNYTEEYFHGCTFKQYMNNEYDENDTYKSVEDNVSEDVFIWIEYTDGSHFCYCDSREGNFKLNGIKWAYISDGSGYTVYKYDLQEEWERVKETLTEAEAEAVEMKIPYEEYKKFRKIADEFHKDTTEDTTEEPEAEEQETTPEEEPAKNTENSVFKYKINILEALKKAGYTTTRIRKEKIFAECTVQKFRTGNTEISLKTLSEICILTNLDPWDIVEYTKKGANEEAETEKEVSGVDELTQETEETTEEYTEKSVNEETETKKEVSGVDELTPYERLEAVNEVANKILMFLPEPAGSEKQRKWVKDLMGSAIRYTQRGAKFELERTELYINTYGNTDEAQEFAEKIEKGCIVLLKAYEEYFRTVKTCREIINMRHLLPTKEPNLDRFEYASEQGKMNFAQHVEIQMEKAFGENWREQ